MSCDDFVIFSDEAHFHLSGTVNKQDVCFWWHNNPHKIQERPLHSPYVTLRRAIPKFHIWGPCFFEDDNITVTVTFEQYCVTLNTFLRAKLNELEYRNNVWFQQDGATSHTSKYSIGILKEIFPNHLISLHDDIGWPARSPDLNPCDFFLWGYLKSRVFSYRPRSLEELIRFEIVAILPEMIHRVIENFRERLQSCVSNNRKHSADLISKLCEIK